MAVASVRSTDLKKTEFTWVDAKVVHEFPEGHELKGHSLVYLDHPEDTAQLGFLQGHCAGTHWIWTSEEKIWYFFTILGPNGQPHVTIHAKQRKWLNTPHPRDRATPMPVTSDRYGVRNHCPLCRGNGQVPVTSPIGKRVWKTCPTCKGKGLDPNNSKVFVKASTGGYSTFADVMQAFESLGEKYEAGKYKPLDFESTTYDQGVSYREAGQNTWDGLYVDPFGYSNPRVKAGKPAHVTDEQWDTYTKVWKEMKDTYDKQVGAIKILGRVFKYDNKELIVLSFSGKGQAEATKYRKGFHEALVELAKKKKGVAVGR